MKPIPLLILGDAPTAGTGLGRIVHDLAIRISENLPGTFRVATLGYGGIGSRHLPFPQYAMEGTQMYIPPTLPVVWCDFAGDEQGVILTIWDASRLLWFTHPEYCPDKRVKAFLEERRFLKWGYLPIDATGPNGKLTHVLRMTIEGFDRVLCYSEWAEKIVRRSLDINPSPISLDQSISWLPHGIDTSVFRPRDKKDARKRVPFPHGANCVISKQGPACTCGLEKALWIGIVATNQRRKDFGLGIQVVAELAKERDVRLWINTDTINREWCIEELLRDYGLLDKTLVTLGGLSDEEMSWYYSACDCTLGIGSGEGFGYPLAESLACGVPVIHGAYGGGEYVPEEFQIEPIALRTEGIYGAQRPVFRVSDWTRTLLAAIGKPCSLPKELDWATLWPRWAGWLCEGVK